MQKARNKLFIYVIILSLAASPIISALIPRCAAADIPVSAESAILICADDNGVIYEKNARRRMAMASTTKIMTCLVAIENGKLDDVVKISPNAVGVEGSSLYLQKGDSVTLEGLLYALMLRSANDTAAAIAYHISGSIEAFAELMNKKAAELGLENTHFTNPHGLQDENHYTTAYDFAILASYAMKNETFAKIVGTRSYTVSLNGGDCLKTVVNHNKMLRLYDGANGVKTGFTKDSGRCLVSSAERDGVSLIAVTLNAPNDWNDHERMLDYGFSQYTHMRLLEKGQLRRTFEVAGCGTVDAVNSDEIWATLRNGADVSYEITASERLLFAPISKGETIAEAKVTAGGKVIGTVPLCATEDKTVPEEEKNFFNKITDKIINFFKK